MAIDFGLFKRPLPASQVEFRMQSINEYGYITVLAYKDARADMERLDDIAPGLWKRESNRRDNKEYCKVSIFNTEIKEWVSFEDTGTASTYEAAKGETSDAFKRACVNLGIGRELYTYPKMEFKLFPNEFYRQQPARNQRYNNANNKPRINPTHQLRLNDWHWIRSYTDQDGKIVLKSIMGIDNNGFIRFAWRLSQGVLVSSPTPIAADKPIPLKDERGNVIKYLTTKNVDHVNHEDRNYSQTQPANDAHQQPAQQQQKNNAGGNNYNSQLQAQYDKSRVNPRQRVKVLSDIEIMTIRGQIEDKGKSWQNFLRINNRGQGLENTPAELYTEILQKAASF